MNFLRWESWRLMPAVFAAHVALYRLLGGRLVGRDILILTTTGRKSGRKRSTPLFFIRHAEPFWIPLAVAAAVWAGLYLRDEGIRGLAGRMARPGRHRQT